MAQVLAQWCAPSNVRVSAHGPYFFLVALLQSRCRAIVGEAGNSNRDLVRPPINSTIMEIDRSSPAHLPCPRPLLARLASPPVSVSISK